MKKNYMMPMLLAVGSLASYGQVAKQLKSPNASVYSNLGTSVVNKNEYSLVGAPYEGQGAAYLFRNGDYVARYTFDKAGDNNSGLGTSVVLNNDWYGAGIPYRNFVDGLGETGFAILGRRSQNAGLNYYLFPSDLQANDKFGQSMAMSENWLAVGAPGQSNEKGAVYLWKQWRSNGSSGWDPMGKLVIPGIATGSGFGHSLAIFEQNGSSDRIIVGAPYSDNSKGKVYVFKRNANTWVLELSYVPSDLGSYSYFGESVDITDNHLIVGAPGVNFKGIATILRYQNGSWQHRTRLQAAANGVLFGRSVSIQYNRAAVGDPLQGTTGELNLYNDENGNYQHKGTLYNGQTSNEYLGWSVDIESDWIVSGAIYATANGVANAGGAYRLEFWKALQSASWRKATTVDVEDISVQLYPNPATGGRVSHNIAGVQQVKAVSALGTITDIEFDANSIDVSTLSAGVYSLRIITEEGTKIQKLAVE